MSAEVPFGRSLQHAFAALLQNRGHKGLRRLREDLAHLDAGAFRREWSV